MSLQLHSVLVYLVLDERNARSFNFEDDNEDEAEGKMLSIAITGAQTKRAAVLSWRERGTQSQEQMSFQGMSVACSTKYRAHAVFLYSVIIEFFIIILDFVILVSLFYVYFYTLFKCVSYYKF